MIKISIFQVIYFYSFSKIRLTAKAFEDTDAEYVPDLSQSDFDMFFFFFFLSTSIFLCIGNTFLSCYELRLVIIIL